MADWKFISLLAISGFLNYFLAQIIAKKEEGAIKKLYFYLGIAFNIGILLYFKYFNFFVESFINLLNYKSDIDIHFTPFHILLPLGISFFTFQLIGYLIDVYNEEIQPTNDLLCFCTYLIYFPKILSGPIERIQQFLPQIEKKREFDYPMAIDGLRQFLWGLFKKVVIANNCISFVNIIFDDFYNLQGSTLFIGAIVYQFSLYADFSGFTDMACGVSKLFGIKITNNFAFPFFSTNISDFWRKWHISLTTWMIDYVFTPLSFVLRRYRKYGLIVSIILTFVLVGLWHGANWTFIIFGVMHGLAFVPLIIWGVVFKETTIAKGRLFPSLKEIFGMTWLFLFLSITAIVFRSDSISNAYSYFTVLFSESLFEIPSLSSLPDFGFPFVVLCILITAFLVVEWIGRSGEYALATVGINWPASIRWSFYYILIIAIAIFKGTHHQFIYFQF
ncbi:MBOAT family O-acyltransferase [uncultured Draconibacterium sp.]|uniref:MBOAT family O-acyltransferase n=1 Tax=uncultured Draconibacterium sp. TaxID=1573823 RepID=UPI0029C94260|nr:MBOAT family O-acyltransferase [uncultured Draconibacterium sp.]